MIMVNYDKVPASHMVEGVRAWVEHGIPPGSFLSALLANDFIGAACKADDVNGKLLYEWAIFLYNEMPVGSYGSLENFKNWEAFKRGKIKD